MMLHDPRLVSLSILVAVQASYVGLTLAVKVSDAVGLTRRLLLCGAALSLGIGIWSMHFIGMLAAKLPVAVDYIVLPTLLSFLICVLVVGVAVFAASLWARSLAARAAAAIFMGSGIAAMHYIGMNAIHASFHMSHAPWMVVASVAVGVSASALALWLAFTDGRRLPLFLGATVLGFAVSGMHYTAMAGLTLHQLDVAQYNASPALSTDLLAIVVAFIAFVISCIFLLTLVPDRLPASVQPSPTPRSASFMPVNDAVPRTDSALAARHGEQVSGLPQLEMPSEPRPRLPIERDGESLDMRLDEIVAVRANAHYTYIFDGKFETFCPLSISGVEERLSSGDFFRVHRSHIVNLNRILSVKKAADNGLVELDAAIRFSVPVSRNRLADLKATLAARRALR